MRPGYFWRMKTRNIEIKWALISAAMFLLWMTMEKLAGLHDKYLQSQPMVTTLILVPSIIIYVLALRDKKKNFYAGHMTYKQGLVSGLVLTLLIVVLSPVNALIAYYVISPDYFANAIGHTVKAGMFTQEQAVQQFNIASYIVSGVAGGLVTGAVFSAVVAVFVRSKGGVRRVPA